MAALVASHPARGGPARSDGMPARSHGRGAGLCGTGRTHSHRAVDSASGARDRDLPGHFGHVPWLRVRDAGPPRAGRRRVPVRSAGAGGRLRPAVGRCVGGLWRGRPRCGQCAAGGWRAGERRAEAGAAQCTLGRHAGQPGGARHRGQQLHLPLRALRAHELDAHLLRRAAGHRPRGAGPRQGRALPRHLRLLHRRRSRGRRPHARRPPAPAPRRRAQAGKHRRFRRRGGGAARATRRQICPGCARRRGAMPCRARLCARRLQRQSHGHCAALCGRADGAVQHRRDDGRRHRAARDRLPAAGCGGRGAAGRLACCLRRLLGALRRRCCSVCHFWARGPCVRLSELRGPSSIGSCCHGRLAH
mmetsp:Transcript_12097/g.30966  ORF Transcript_12097/g.30966 Transcript_12097/m.30966 type:complete len:361 (-) Transcript_12097:60-1142(-)